MMNIISLAPTPPYKSGLSYYVLYLYSNFSTSNKINIITNKNSLTLPCNNITISKTFTPGISALWSCLRRIRAQRRADILHLHVEYSFLGSWLNFLLLPIFLVILRLMLRNSKIIVTLHGVPNYWSILFYLKRKSRIPIVSGPIALIYTIFSFISIRLSCIISDAVIVHTTLMKSALASFIPHSLLSKVHVIPHGSYEPPDWMKKSEINKNFIYILTIGYLRPSKGIKTLLKAAQEIINRTTNVKFVIVGTSIQKFIERGEKMTGGEVGGRIMIVNSLVKDNALDEIIRKADIIVLPYEDMFLESSGALHRVVLFGKALICSNIPRFRSHLINEVNALLFRPGDYRELAAHLFRLINDNLLRKRLSERLVDSFTHTRWKIIAKRHEELFLALLSNKYKIMTKRDELTP
jgi:glycosyltransferase involved in cell wall biosynthesis